MGIQGRAGWGPAPCRLSLFAISRQANTYYNPAMHIPPSLPGLKLLTIILFLYGMIWIALEGALGRVLPLAVLATLVGIGRLWQRFLAGQTLTRPRWLLLVASSGLAAGLGSGLLSLLFMALKTGLHAHGPEFTAEQIAWVVGRIPYWTLGGLLAGLGIGLLFIARQSTR